MALSAQAYWDKIQHKKEEHKKFIGLLESKYDACIAHKIETTDHDYVLVSPLDADIAPELLTEEIKKDIIKVYESAGWDAKYTAHSALHLTPKPIRSTRPPVGFGRTKGGEPFNSWDVSRGDT
jgi:hypothetical protein